MDARPTFDPTLDGHGQSSYLAGRLGHGLDGPEFSYGGLCFPAPRARQHMAQRLRSPGGHGNTVRRRRPSFRTSVDGVVAKRRREHLPQLVAIVVAAPSPPYAPSPPLLERLKQSRPSIS